jgi:hypothetical protein
VNHGNSKEEPDQDPEDHQEGQCRSQCASYQRRRCDAENSCQEGRGLADVEGDSLSQAGKIAEQSYELSSTGGCHKAASFFVPRRLRAKRLSESSRQLVTNELKLSRPSRNPPEALNRQFD